MALSEETVERVKLALAALNAVRDEYKDVLVVLDYTTLADIANAEADSDAGESVGSLLDEEQLAAILWRLGKHVGGDDTSHSLLPAIIQFELDDRERRSAL
jgi:hypothetical protein